MDQETQKLVESFIQKDGTLLLPCSNNWWLEASLANPDDSVWYTTTEPGNPHAPKKLHSAIIHPGPPYPQLIFVENDLKEDGTVGAIEPLVCLVGGNAFVAVRKNKRHNGEMYEAWRKSWSSEFQQPGVQPGLTLQKYDDDSLGRGLANSARLIAVDALAEIGYKLTVIAAAELPELEAGGEWMPMADFMTQTLDQMGKTVLGVAVYLGILPRKG